MPELPEVEVSRLGISPFLVNEKIDHVIVRDKRLRWPVPEQINQVQSEPIIAVTRRAKYLLIQLKQGHIVLHLGMSGKLCVVDAKTQPAKHDHIDFVLSSGNSLRFTDPRRFGACLWQENGTQLKQFDNLGPEPLTSDFDDERLHNLSRGKRSPVKTFIMDNHVVVGVGNIYANESLFLSGIDPRRPAGNISKKRYKVLTGNIKQVLSKAIEQGGTTLKDFASAEGKPGYFAQYLRVYGKKGQPCEVCETPIKSKTIGQRNTFYCPNCQR